MHKTNKNSRHKILFLIPSLVGGGAERTLVNILNKLSDDDTLKITLVVVANIGIYKNQIPKSIKVISLFENNHAVRILSLLQKKIGFTYLFKTRVRKKVKGNFNTAISFLDSNFTDLIFFLPHVEKRVAWVHSSYKSNMNFSRFYKNTDYRDTLIKNRYKKLDSIVFVSDDAKSEFISLFGNYPEMPVIFNLLDETSVKSKAKAFTVEEKKAFSFIAIGSYYPVKGYDKLLKAAAIVRDKKLDFTIDVYGQGFLKEDLLHQIQQADLEKNISLNDFVENPYPMIASADVFIMTSISEAMPMALCEAILLGKPTLVTNCSGCREVVNYGKYGMIVEQTPEAIAEGMMKFITDAGYMSKYERRANERAVVFSDKTILNQIKQTI